MRNFSIIGAVNSKRRKCTAEVLVSLLRSRSSSAIARTAASVPTIKRDHVLDAAQIFELALAHVDVVVLDQHRRFEIGAIRNQRIVGVEFLFDRFGFEDALDAQHFLHLILDRHAIFEDQRDVCAEMQRPVLLVRDHLRAERAALARVVFEFPEIGVR